MDLLPIMIALKKRTATPPGIGFGPKGAYPDEDGIEAKVNNLAKKELPQLAMKKQADDRTHHALRRRWLSSASRSTRRRSGAVWSSR
jgi:hypothetical protein